MDSIATKLRALNEQRDAIDKELKDVDFQRALLYRDTGLKIISDNYLKAWSVSVPEEVFERLLAIERVSDGRG